MKTRIIKYLSVGVYVIFGYNISIAQVSDNSLPASFSISDIKSNIQHEVMPGLDIDKLIHEDLQDEKHGIPYRFGKDISVDYTLENSGAWVTLDNKDRIWRLKITSTNAYSINLVFKKYFLPQGAKLHVYNSNKSHVIGGFTNSNNKTNMTFATQPVKGSSIILEYYEPHQVLGKGIIHISKVIHGYKNVFGFKNYGDSQSCNINVNCVEGDNWQDEKRGVAMILLDNNTRLCSGGLINNVRQDGAQYFLTANHCLRDEDTWIFMFNYESPTCENQDGPTNKTVQGAILRANNSTSDFALLELTETIPDSYNVYYNGWDNSGNVPANTHVIHHPSGDIKKISYDLNSSLDNGNYWRVDYEGGTTEGGSSGSNLLDQNHRIVGQLCCGSYGCDVIDDFGKLSASWTGSGTNSTRLSNWLDPDNTGVTALDGMYINCQENIVVSDNINGGVHEFLASNTITASNVISNGAIVKLGANNSIHLVKGFRVNLDVDYFRAHLDGCNTGSLKSIRVGNESIADNGIRKEDNTEILATHNLENELSIFPNPSNGIFSISFENDFEKGEIIIINLSGVIIQNQTITERFEQVDLSNREKGVYFIRITTDSGPLMKKLILN